MSKIKLRVPKKPAAESVSIGNFHADLKPGSVVTTDSRQFADYLSQRFGCEEVEDKKAETPETAPAGDGGDQ